jgi:predicted RNA-binding Zn-ribbon protein involved in translation (DUF1610 family)
MGRNLANNQSVVRDYKCPIDGSDIIKTTSLAHNERDYDCLQCGANYHSLRDLDGQAKAYVESLRIARVSTADRLKGLDIKLKFIEDNGFNI